MKNILVIEDEEIVRSNILEILESGDFPAIGAENGRRGVELACETIPSLIICDITMPELDGYGVLKMLRQNSATETIPFIFLTARADKTDIRTGMNLGADDYLTKPFGVGELLARVKAVLRRSQWMVSPISQGKLVSGNIVVNLERHEVLVSDEVIKLTPTEYNLLIYLMEHAGIVLSHDAILKKVWGPEYGEETEYLRVYIGHLRQKIESDPTNPEYLITERGIGYRFENVNS